MKGQNNFLWVHYQTLKRLIQLPKYLCSFFRRSKFCVMSTNKIRLADYLKSSRFPDWNHRTISKPFLAMVTYCSCFFTQNFYNYGTATTAVEKRMKSYWSSKYIRAFLNFKWEIISKSIGDILFNFTTETDLRCRHCICNPKAGTFY